MKLKTYQQGGGLIYTPFIPEQAAASSRSAASSGSSSTDEDSKIDPLDKELLNLMKGQNLLSSDINLIYDRLIAFHRRTQSLSSLGSGNYRSVMPGMLQIMKLVENAKANKAEWDEKVAEIRHHDAGAEVAMDSMGRMWVQDPEKGLTLVRPSEFNPKTQVPVSNSQLIALRRRDPSLAFNDAILGDTGIDVVGASDIRKEIDDIISKAGSIKEVSFGSIPFSQIAADLQGEGIYKTSQKYSKADLKGFAELLYSQLSNSAKHLVTANAAIGGYDKIEYIKSIVATRTDVDPDLSYEASLTKASGMGGAGGSGADGDDPKNLKERSWTEQLAGGYNFELPKMTSFNPVSTITLHAPAQNTGGMKKDDGKTPILPGMVDAIMEQAGWFKQISGQSTVTFGDQIIDETALGQLMYDGSTVYRIKLPYKEVNGELTVNWDLVEELENINKQIKGATPGMIEDLLADHPELRYNKETKLVEAVNSEWFLAFGGMIGDDFVNGLDTDSRYIERMDDDKSKYWQDKYREAIEYGFVNHGKNDPKRTDVAKDTWRWLNKNRFYKGNVFVPIRLKLAGANEYYPAASHMNNMQTEALNARNAQIQQQVDTNTRKFNW